MDQTEAANIHNKTYDFKEPWSVYKQYIKDLSTLNPNQLIRKELRNHEVKDIKQKIDSLYKNYNKKKINLQQIQGIWPFLSMGLSGITPETLYNECQSLLNGFEQYNVDLEEGIKLQQIPFNQSKYFKQNNHWKDDQIFMKSLLLFQSIFKGYNTQEQILQHIQTILRCLNSEKISFQIELKTFMDGFEMFKSRLFLDEMRSQIRNNKVQNKQKINQMNKSQQQLHQSNLLEEPSKNSNIIVNFQIKIENLEQIPYGALQKSRQVNDITFNMQRIQQPVSQKRILQNQQIIWSQNENINISKEFKGQNKFNPLMKWLIQEQICTHTDSKETDKNIAFGYLSIIKIKIQHESQDFNTEFYKEYIMYLQQFQGQEILIQSQRVFMQLINRQQLHLDGDLCLKIICLLIVAQKKRISNKDWQIAYTRYIKDMLTFTIHSNIYLLLFQITDCLIKNNHSPSQLLKNGDRYFKNILLMGSIFQNNNILQIILQIIYDAMITIQQLTILKTKNYYLTNFTTLKNPFKSHLLKLQMLKDNEDNILCLIISGMIFQSLYLSSIQQILLKCKIDIELIKGKYLRSILDSYVNNQKYKLKDSWIYKFCNILQKYQSTYHPIITKQWFSFLMRVQLQFLQKSDSGHQQSVIFHNLQKSFEFIQYIIKEQIQRYDLSFQEMIERLFLQTQIQTRYSQSRIVSHIIITTITYKVISQYPQFNNRFPIFIIYLRQIIVPQFSNIIDNYPTFYPQICELLYRVYEQYMVNSQNQKEMLFTSRQSQISNQVKYLQQIILKFYVKLQETYRQLLKQVSRRKLIVRHKNNQQHNPLKSKEDIKSCIQVIEDRIIIFLERYALNQKLLKSTSHQLFFINEILFNHHFYYKFFENQCQYREFISPKISLIVYNVIKQYFGFPFCLRYNCNASEVKIEWDNHENIDPNIENAIRSDAKQILQQYNRYQLSRYVTQKIINYSLPTQKSFHQYILSIVSHLSNISTICAVQIIYFSKMASKAFYQNGKFTLQGNIILQYIQNTLNSSLITPLKIKKCILLINQHLSMINSYMQVVAYNVKMGRQSMKKCQNIKQMLIFNVINKHCKSLAMLIFVGLAVKNVEGYETLEISQIIQKLMQHKQWMKNRNINKYMIFITPFQPFQQHSNRFISQLLENLFFQTSRLQGNKDNYFKEIVQMIEEVYSIFDNISKYTDRSAIIIQIIKILNVILKIKYENIFYYFNSVIKKSVSVMKTSSLASNPLSNIKITEINLHLLLDLFNNIDKIKQNIFGIKSLSSIYIQILMNFEMQYKQSFCSLITKVLMCVSSILQKDQSLMQIGQWFIQNIMNHFFVSTAYQNITSKNSKRLVVLLQTTKHARQQKRVYQNMILLHKQAILRIISWQEDNQDTFSAFQVQNKAVVDKMLHKIFSRYDNFLKLKYQKHDDYKQMLVILQKMTALVTDKQNNILLRWCLQQQKRTKQKQMKCKQQQMS